jgi:hypothetical protein
MAAVSFDFQTNSVADARYMMGAMVTLLKHNGFALLTIEQTGRMLANKLGISLGGQISGIEIHKIAAGLGVDSVIIECLNNFGGGLLSYHAILIRPIVNIKYTI